MSYEALVLTDSVNNFGDRLVTYSVTFPRFILAEVNTHRMLSRNSASSRAIPPERIIEEVETNPFVPMTFNKRVKGMGVGEALAEEDQMYAREIWLKARDEAINHARRLLAFDVDKSRVNRLLEPFMWHTAVLTATEWENFFALRCPDGPEPDINFPAQLEFQKLCLEMKDALDLSRPQHLTHGQWHLPLITDDDWGVAAMDTNSDIEAVIATLKMVSAGRLARYSSYNRRDPEPMSTSYERAESLSKSGHWSPFEHIATPAFGSSYVPWSGNFKGWLQFRKEFKNEDNYAEIRYVDA